jgi:hypothetical protein
VYTAEPPGSVLADTLIGVATVDLDLALEKPALMSAVLDGGMSVLKGLFSSLIGLLIGLF